MTGPQEEPVTFLAIGGPKHGQRLPVAEGSGSYVDLMSASTYYIKPMSYIRRDPNTTAPNGLFQVGVLVHESLMPAHDDGPLQKQAKGQAVNSMWIDVMMADWMSTHGEQKPLTDLPPHMRGPLQMRPVVPPAGDQN